MHFHTEICNYICSKTETYQSRTQKCTQDTKISPIFKTTYADVKPCVNLETGN